jgi:putative DNA methylase
VAVLIQRAMLEIPYRFGDGPSIHPSAPARLSTRSSRDRLAEDFKLYGEDLRAAALTELAAFYPNVISSGGDSLVPIAWIWARTVESPDPSWRGHVPLVGSWLIRNAAPRVWVSPRIDNESQVITYEIREGGSPPERTVGRAGARCIATGSPIPFAYIREQASAGKLGTTLLAIVAEGNRARVYLPPSQGHVDAASGLKPSWSPDEQLQGKARQNVSLYGLDRFWQLFTARQLGTLTHLVDLLPALRERVVSDAVSAGLHDDGVRLRDGGTGAQAYGDAITTFFAFAIDRLADWNNSLCRWENKAQVPQQLFGRHSMPMVWDFAEANVFSTSTGSLAATLNTLSTAIMALPNAEQLEWSKWMPRRWSTRWGHVLSRLIRRTTQTSTYSDHRRLLLCVDETHAVGNRGLTSAQRCLLRRMTRSLRTSSACRSRRRTGISRRA